MTKERLFAHIVVALAGKLGEEVIEGADKHTTGCFGDYKSARNSAYDYVVTYGFGKLIYAPGNNWKMSDKYKTLIDQEIKQLLDDANKRAKEIIVTHADKHLKLTEKLLEKQTLTAAEMKQILSD